ncbi:CHAP domain-containing protein [Kitasatospora aureofaciens]|uniref:CHAP domain-containing protein n=1 Tax=Kitasatospora aureofaciens TaxID=1894 RepID=UPI000524D331|nr:CHAP domain-containing protein [Kitasatospora aureofaciens]
MPSNRRIRSIAAAAGVALSGLTLSAVTVQAASAATDTSKIISSARSQLGSNGCGVVDCSVEWCAEFSKWAWQQGGVNVSTLGATVTTFVNYGDNNGTWHDPSGYTPRPGDAMIFGGAGFPTKASGGAHVGLVESVSSNGTITEIGGNQGGHVTEVTGTAASIEAQLEGSSYSFLGYVSPVGAPTPVPAGFNVTVDANGAPLTNGRTVSGVVNLTAPPTSQGVINSLYYNFTGPTGSFTINGGTGANNYAQSWNTTGLPNGTYTVQVGANEIDGQSHAYPGAPISFTVNNTPPTPSTPSANAPGGQVFGSIQLSASGLSGSTASVTYKVDGNQVGNSTAGGAFPLTIDTTTLTDGPHTVTASALNSTGAASPDSSPITLTVDNNRSHTASQAAAQSNGTVDLLYKAGDGTLGHVFYTRAGASWATSAPVGASMASQPSTVTTGAGVVDSFWEGTDGNLWHATYFPGGPTPGWQPPQSLGMGPLGGAPKAIAASDGTIDVFWNGGGDAPHLWHAWYNPGGSWNGPQDLTPTISAAGYVTGEPAPVTSAPGRVEVFWKGADNNLWHAPFFPGSGAGSGWQGPSSLGMGPLGGTPKAIGQINGTVDVFWKGTGTNPDLWHAWWNQGQPWAGPQDLGGANLQSDPVPVNSAAGVLDVFWQGTDNNLWHVPFFPGSGSGSGWQSPSSIGMGPLGSAPFAAAQPNGTIDVFWKGSGAGSGNIWHAWWNQGQPWAGAQNLGGNIAAN